MSVEGELSDSPPDIDANLKEWRQGDVANINRFVHVAETSAPLTPQAKKAASEAKDAGRIRITTEVEALVLLTQTCDIRRTAATRPFLDVAPLVNLTGDDAELARKGLRPAFAHVPGAGDDFFADLDRVMTVEKPVIANAERVPGCRTSQEARRFGLAVGRKHSRFAFPDDFTRTIGKLGERIKDKHGKQGPEGAILRQVEEIRVLAEPDWESESISVTLVFIFKAGFLPDTDPDAPIAQELLEWLRLQERNPPDMAERFHAEQEPAHRALLIDALAEKWIGMCTPTGSVTEVGFELVGADEFTIERVWVTDALDLDYLSDA